VVRHCCVKGGVEPSSFGVCGTKDLIERRAGLSPAYALENVTEIQNIPGKKTKTWKEDPGRRLENKKKTTMVGNNPKNKGFPRKLGSAKIWCCATGHGKNNQTKRGLVGKTIELIEAKSTRGVAETRKYRV